MERKDKRGRKLRVGEYYDSKNERYLFRKMINGKRYTITDTDLVSLRKRAAALAVDIDNNNIYTRDMNKMTLDEYFECWCDNSGKSSRKATTYMNYQAYYKAHVMGTELGKMKIGNIRKTHCQSLFNEMIKKGYKKSTLNNMKGCLSIIFSEAEDDDLVAKNPCKNIRFIQAGKGKRQAISKEQVNIFMDFVREDEEFSMYYPFFVILFNLGTRIGEASAITWDCVDFVHSKVTIDKSLNRYRKKEYGFTVAIGSTKSKNGVRTITVNETVIRALKEQRRIQLENEKNVVTKVPRVDDYGRVIGEINNLVFTQMNGQAWYEPVVINVIHRIVKRQNEQAEQEEKEKLQYFTPHQIRHTYTTLAFEAGVDEKEVALRLGHASELTARDVYTHLRGQKKQEQDEIINSIQIG